MDPKIRAILERPFEMHLQKQRQGPGGQVFTYVEIQFYVDRLNEAFGGDWSLESVRREIIEDQIIVEVRLTAGGVVKTGIGGGLLTRRRDNGRLVGLADDFKKGEADAIKRACRLLGIGGSLYGSEVVEASNDEVVAPEPHRSRAVAAPRSGSEPTPVDTRARITAKQVQAIWSIVRQRGHDQGAFRRRIRERFGKQLEYLTKKEGSEIIEVLMASDSGTTNGNGNAYALANRPSDEAQ